MKCRACKIRVRPGDLVVPVFRVAARQDFEGDRAPDELSKTDQVIHIHHILS